MFTLNLRRNSRNSSCTYGLSIKMAIRAYHNFFAASSTVFHIKYGIKIIHENFPLHQKKNFLKKKKCQIVVVAEILLHPLIFQQLVIDREVPEICQI